MVARAVREWVSIWVSSEASAGAIFVEVGLSFGFFCGAGRFGRNRTLRILGFWQSIEG